MSSTEMTVVCGNDQTIIQMRSCLKCSFLFVTVGGMYIILNSVRQHNYFITQGNYIGYMFRL